MRKGVLISGLLGAALACLPSGASGQVLFGAEALFGTETDFGLGARIHYDLGTSAPLEFQGAFDLFFPDGPADYWEINTNLWYNLPTSGGSTALPYLGGGLNIGHVSGPDGPDDTELGVNLGGGVKFGFTNTIPFLEARVTVGGIDEQLVIGGGVLFGG